MTDIRKSETVLRLAGLLPPLADERSGEDSSPQPEEVAQIFGTPHVEDAATIVPYKGRGNGTIEVRDGVVRVQQANKWLPTLLLTGSLIWVAYRLLKRIIESR